MRRNVKANAALNRWERKFPHNRKGSKPGDVCPYFNCVRRPYMALVKSEGWVEDYQNARMPKSHPELVKPLRHSIDEINRMYFRCKKWFEEENNAS